MYKVGDKLICKQQFYCNKPDIVFLIGLEYFILDNQGDMLRIGRENNIKCSYWFYNHYEEILEYFYTEKELRKKKLERLNNV